MMKKIQAVPFIVSVLTLLCAFVLAALQFTRIIILNPAEENAIILILLTLIGGSLLFEQQVVLRTILQKLDKLEKHLNARKPVSVSEKSVKY
jgi:hypothetical protein